MLEVLLVFWPCVAFSQWGLGEEIVFSCRQCYVLSPRATDLELLPQLGGVALRVHPQHVLVGEGKLVHQDGRLSAQARFQDGVVDEDVLLLRHRWRRGRRGGSGGGGRVGGTGGGSQGRRA